MGLVKSDHIKRLITLSGFHCITVFTKLSGLPISEVPFPSVVICSQGSNMETFYAAYFKIILDYMKNKTGIVHKTSPYEFSRSQVKLMQNIVSTMEVTKCDH